MFDRDIYFNFLKTSRLGKELVTLDIVDSTNAWVAERLDEQRLHFAVVVAENQTEGRGRLGRNWLSPPLVNLAFSLAWGTNIDIKNLNTVTLAAGIALCCACQEVAKLTPELKYPNDLVFNGKKLGGILAELRQQGDQNIVVLGIGVNVNTQNNQFPEELQRTSTSLFQLTGMSLSREKLLASMINHLELWLDFLSENGSKLVIEEYRKYCSTFIQREVEVISGSRIIVGVAVGIDDNGGLLVEVSPGVVETVYSGETRFFD
jgi:BirA family biotin operon repressor/biotin-[acetyl-CoA-carboxylase] ligase